MASSVAEILRLVGESKIDFDALERQLDAASHEERLTATRQFNKKIQRRLFEQAAGRTVTFDQIVPHDDPMKPVHHHGKNTVAPFLVDHFQKRFVRVPGRDDVLYGYNENWYRFAVSPGYYVAYEDENTGEVVVNYTQMPDSRPDEWPHRLPNWFGLGPFIFLGMRDRLRRVSDHVTIGRAYRKKPMNQWFVLTRED